MTQQTGDTSGEKRQVKYENALNKRMEKREGKSESEKHNPGRELCVLSFDSSGCL